MRLRALLPWFFSATPLRRDAKVSCAQGQPGRPRGPAGMTLIEILVVVAIIGIMVASIGVGASALPRARLRGSAVRLASVMRFAYVHALTTGRTTRVTLRLGTGQLSVEDTEDAHTLEVRDPRRAGDAADVEREAQRRAELMADLRPRATRASFRPVRNRLFRTRTLERDVVVSRLYTQHEAEAREEGTGYVYFFPGGVAERATVHLRNGRGETFSVSLNPLTGRAEVNDRPVEPPNLDDRDTLDQNELDVRDRQPQETEP